jgi:hypothetical protein
MIRTIAGLIVLAAASIPSLPIAQSEAAFRLECTEWVNSNVQHQGARPPQGRTVGRTYVAASPLEHLAYVVQHKRLRDARQQAFDTCMQAKRDEAAQAVRAQPPSRPATPPGCARDTDCKGERICVSGACVDPPRGGGVLPAVVPAPLADLPDLNGTWTGTIASSAAGTYSATLRLSQQASELRGEYASSFGGTGTVLGAVVGRDSSLAITSTTPRCEGSLTGRFEADPAAKDRILLVYEGRTACGGPERGRGVLTRQQP